MTDPNNDHLSDIFEADAEEKRQKKLTHQQITVRDYIKLLEKDPLIAQSSPARISEFIHDGGLAQVPDEDRWMGVDMEYSLFSKELFGVNAAIAKIVEHIKVGEAKGSSGKQIPILVGPPAAGKSTFMRLLMENLERYRKRPVFMIRGCPKQEEPLHLLPRSMRKNVAIKKEDCPECANLDKPKHIHLGIKIEGDLCPVCRDIMLTKYKNGDEVIRWWDIPVETFTFSQQARRGIGSFEPSDEKSSDITILSGRENINITSSHGYKHPRAFELSGEIPAGERGTVEGREVLSSDPSVLRVFFSVAEEKQLKIEGSYYPHISVDTTIIGHTNLTVFKKFNGNKEYEGLHDRFFVIPWPYPIRISEEIRLYRKLIERESDFVKIKKCHIAPGTLELAATFAVLTRLTDSQMGIDRLTKAKAYNGDKILSELRDKDRKPLDLRELLAESQSNPDIAKREGMFGVSSRTILAALNTALSQEAEKNGCLTPTKAIVALRDGFENRMGFTPEDLGKFRELLSSGEGGNVLSEYKDYVITAVTRAFLKAYDDLARQIFNDYIEEAELYRSTKRKFVRGSVNIEREGLTGKPKEPRVKFLRSVEEYIPLDESAADIFRGEILEFRASSRSFGYDTYPPLARAVQKKLLADSKSTLKLVLATDKPRNDEETRRANDLFSELTNVLGYCNICAKEILERSAEFLSE